MREQSIAVSLEHICGDCVSMNLSMRIILIKV